MSHHFNELTPAEAERLAVLSEEMGEAQQAIGKILRHGYESVNPDSKKRPNPTNRRALERELGDVLFAIENLTRVNDVRYSAVQERSFQKIEKAAPYLHHQESAGAPREGNSK